MSKRSDSNAALDELVTLNLWPSTTSSSSLAHAAKSSSGTTVCGLCGERYTTAATLEAIRMVAHGTGTRRVAMRTAGKLLLRLPVDGQSLGARALQKSAESHPARR